jgi:WD40 repeat protein/biotin carboxyl carrier protein
MLKLQPILGLLVGFSAAVLVHARADDVEPVKKASFNSDSSNDGARTRRPPKLATTPSLESPADDPAFPLPTPGASPSSLGVFVRPLVIPQNQVRMPEEIRVPSEIAGVLAEMAVQEGAVVKKGDVIAKLDDSIAKLDEEMKMRTAKNESSVEIADRKISHYDAQLKRAEKLLRTGGTSHEEVEVARTQVDLARAEMKDAKIKMLYADIEHEMAEEKLSRHVLKSPVGGIITQRLKHPGEAVQAMEPICHLVRTDRVKVQGQIDSRYADRLSQGMAVEVWPEIAVGERTTFSHSAPIRCVKILPDDRRVAFGGDDGRVVVVNFATGASEREFGASTKAIRGLAVSAAEPNQLVTCSEDGAIGFWNLADGLELRPKLRTPDRGEEPVLSVCLDPKNPSLGWTGHQDGRICQWDFAKGVVVKTFSGGAGDKAHVNEVTCLTLSPDGESLLSVGNDRAARLWKTADGSLVTSFDNRSGPAQKEVRMLNFSIDGTELPFNSDGMVQFKRIADAVVSDAFETVEQSFASFVMMTPTAGLVLTARENGELQLWQRAKGHRPPRLARTYKGHRTEALVHQVDFSSGGKFFVSCCADRTVKVWAMPTTAELDAERLGARVSFVDPQAGPTGACAFHAEVDNRTGVLKGNTTASVVVYPQ